MSDGRIVVLAQAAHDLGDLVEYRRLQSALVSLRFVESVESTLTRLERLPGIETRFDPDDEPIADIRFVQVTDFPRHLIFDRA